MLYCQNSLVLFTEYCRAHICTYHLQLRYVWIHSLASTCQQKEDSFHFVALLRRARFYDEMYVPVLVPGLAYKRLSRLISLYCCGSSISAIQANRGSIGPLRSRCKVGKHVSQAGKRFEGGEERKMSASGGTASPHHSVIVQTFRNLAKSPELKSMHAQETRETRSSKRSLHQKEELIAGKPH